jgi:hypothetical protein
MSLQFAAPLLARLVQPSPESVRQAREVAGLTQAGAAQLVTTAAQRPHRTWQGYEVPVGRRGHRAIPLATWELFLLLTEQHPTMRIQVGAAVPTEIPSKMESL